MRASQLNLILPPEDIHKYFVLEGSRLYRKLATGACSQLKSMDGRTVVTLFKGNRLPGVDIAWCLIYGNWPEFPIVQLKEDPLDFSRHNLYAARLHRLRYIEHRRGKLYTHPLSSIGHATPEACRQHWEDLAHDFYIKDALYVSRLEDYNRTLREQTLRSLNGGEAPVRSDARPVRTQRPPAVLDKEWHWSEDEWICVPVACHVADDYRMRIAAWRAGARSFRFDPDLRQVRAFYPSGEEWMKPAASTASSCP